MMKKQNPTNKMKKNKKEMKKKPKITLKIK